MLVQLNFPTYDFRISDIEGKTYIFDIIRKKYVMLTPEEWVRQHIVKFLIDNQYPISLISVEKQIKVNHLKKRFDVLVFNKLTTPVMLIECKAPDIKLTQESLNQIALYNTQFKVDYLFISNGIQHLICKFNKEQNKYFAVDSIPTWNNLNNI